MWLEVRTIPFSPQRHICGVWMRVRLALPNKQMRKKEMVLPLMDDFVCVCVRLDDCNKQCTSTLRSRPNAHYIIESPLILYKKGAQFLL